MLTIEEKQQINEIRADIADLSNDFDEYLNPPILEILNRKIVAILNKINNLLGENNLENNPNVEIQQTLTDAGLEVIQTNFDGSNTLSEILNFPNQNIYIFVMECGRTYILRSISAREAQARFLEDDTILNDKSIRGETFKIFEIRSDTLIGLKPIKLKETITD